MMKLFRNIILLLLATVAFSCSKKPDTPVYEPQIIRFTPKVLSKAYVNDADDETFKKNGFGVFVQKEHEKDGVKELMENVNVRNDKGNGWHYDSKYFWGLDCTHYFLGIYPYDMNTCMSAPVPGNASSSFLNDIYTWNNIDTAGGKGVDLLYGRFSVHYSLEQKPAPVALEMHHALSALSFSLRNVSNTAFANMEMLRLSNIYTKASAVKIARKGTGPAEITIDETSNVTPYEFSYNKAMPTDPNIYHPIVQPFVIVPQDFTNYSQMPLYIKLDTGKTNADGLKEYKEVNINLALYKVDNDDPHDIFKYLPGHHYHYTIDITERNITVSVTVVPWIKDDIADL